MDAVTAVDVPVEDPVERTWQEIGYRIRALRWMVFVRTELPPQMVGSLYLPPKQASFYGTLPHLVTVKATVLSAGPKAHGIKAGDRIAFQRLHFARLLDMPDGTKVGWVEANQVIGHVEE